MSDNIKYGWIGLYRSITNHWLYPLDRTFTKYEAWIDILLTVNHSDKKVFNGSDTEICEAGQIFTSQKKLMSKWKWSKSKLISFLKVLEKEQMIVLKTTTKKTTIKVVNFQSYQDFRGSDKIKKDRKKTAKRPQKDFKKTSKRLQKATNNNDNNYNNDNNDNKVIKTNTEKTEKVFSEEVLNCFDYCLNFFSDNLKPKNKNKWLDTIEKLNRIDKYSFQEIKHIVKSARNDDFWKMQFLSIQKLRKNNRDGVKYFTVFQERFNSNNNNSSNQNYDGNR